MYSSCNLDNSQTSRRPLRRIAVAVVAVALLSLPALAQTYVATTTTSDIANVSRFTDPNLVNPWGLSISPQGPWWVSDNGSGLSTLYDGNGTPQQLVVTIPAWNGPNGGSPSGTVFNGTSDFQLAQGDPAFFLFSTEDGTISGWNPSVNPTSAVVEVNNWPNAVYKGLAMASAGGNNYLYAADFRGGKVAVFDKSFAPFSFGPNAFVDSTIPPGFAPFNVQLIAGNKLVVTYAKQNAAKHDDIAGAGNGYVRVFDTQGNLLLAVPHQSVMDSPWAVALAPQGFGSFSGDLLIGNFGSGAIAAFDPTTGAFIGLMLDQSGLPLRIDGLWALAFGNGGGGGPTTTLHFTAGVFGETHGLFGSIVPACVNISCTHI
jgi:uncharacterized protein (TIGR03118 family)